MALSVRITIPVNAGPYVPPPPPPALPPPIPTYNAVSPTEEIKFRCEITNKSAGDFRYAWVSNIDGRIKVEDITEPFHEFRAQLSSGTHIIDVYVYEKATTPDEGRSRIKIVIPPHQMRVRITSPADKSHFPILTEPTTGDAYHDQISFSMSITGGTPPYTIRWLKTSKYKTVKWTNHNNQKDFKIGGVNHPVRNQLDPQASLPQGVYRIRASVKDALNRRDTALITLYIGDISPETPETQPPYSVTLSPYGKLEGTDRPEGRAIGRFARSALGFKAKKFTDPKYEKRNPAARAAVNKGKRELNAMARRIAKTMIDKYENSLNKMKDIWEKKKDDWDAKRKEARSFLRKSGGKSIISSMKFSTNLADVAGGLGKALGNVSDPARKARASMLQQELDQTFQRFSKADGALNTLLTTKVDELEKEILERLNPVAEAIAKKHIYRFRIKEPEEKDYILAELKEEATFLSESLAKTGRVRLRGIAGRLKTISMRGQTATDVWHTFLDNIWNIIIGPWTVGTIFIIIQFFFITAYVGYHPLLLFWIPIAGAILTFLLNFEQAKQPLDWIGHLASGAMISMAFVILFYSLGITMENMGGGTGFFIFGGLIFVFIGLFQFYQAGGFRTALMLTIIALLFGYVALGPYSGYWQVIKDQIKTPINMAWKAIKGAVEDIWLLATNPTEWYARQQLQSVRPEKPIDFPKGVEVTLFDAIPPSVPATQEFAVTAVFRNEGEMEAKDIKVTAECNQWCDTRYVVSDSKFKKESDGFYHYYIEDSEGNEVRGNLERKEANTITLSHLVAKTIAGREAEFRMAKVTLKVSYRYHTSASLLVDVMHEDELQRLFREGHDVYRNVLAVEKVTPAKLSINVGPQPLKAGTTGALLLVSISNVRDDGEIRLTPEDTIKIKMPKTLGSGLECGGYKAAEEGSNWVLNYRIPKELTIEAYDFSSIFAVLCSFDVTPNVGTKTTGLITAELGDKDTPGFEFITKKEKDVPITTPLGILYDPFDRECKKCGDGLFDRCTKGECENIKDDQGNKCWFRDRGGPGIVTGGECHSCSSIRGCLQFSKDENECAYGAGYCGFSCEWHKLKEGEKIPVSAGGAELGLAKGWCEEKPLEYQKCSVDVTDASQLSGTRLSSCAQHYDTFKKYWEKNNIKSSGIDLLFLLTLAYGESDCSMGAQSASGHGIMQVVKDTAESECKDIGTYEQINNDVDKNINCGTKVFYKYMSEVRNQGVSNNEVLTLTLFSYNRGPGAMKRAVELKKQGYELVLAMREACYEYYDKGAYGNCANLGRETCCFGDGYGAKYPEKYFKIYNQACQQLQGTIQTIPQPWQIGSENYCRDYRQSNCLFGEGLCNNFLDCESNCWAKEFVKNEKGVTIEEINHQLECRQTTVGKLCCFTVFEKSGETLEQSNANCLQRFNDLKNGIIKEPICAT